LSLGDHLDWDGQQEEHLFLLQNKFNSYLKFIESGELRRKYPTSIGRKVTINIVGKYPLSEQAETFLDNARAAIKNAGFLLTFSVLAAGHH
jgi:hypothetical protein